MRDVIDAMIAQGAKVVKQPEEFEPGLKVIRENGSDVIVTDIKDETDLLEFTRLGNFKQRIFLKWII